MDVATTANRLLPGLEHRPTELGRIRLGDKRENAQGKVLPHKIETWRLTSGNREVLDAAAAIYGGTVEEWADAPNEGFWQLLTDSNTLKVLIPRDLRTLTQSYEWWQGGTCERRCDGTTEQISGLACLCKAEGTMECRPRTRLNIMLPDIPGLGVWRLETDGYNAATSLPATIELLLSLSEQPWVRAVLRLEQRSAKKRDEKGKVMTHRFAVPVLDLPDVTLGKIVTSRLKGQQTEQLPESVPQTAAERVAAQRAEIEARTTEGRGATAGPDAEPAREGDEPPHPATTSGESPTGRVPSPGQDEPGSNAGARTATSGTPSSADASEPTPAHDDSGASLLASESSPERCEGFHEEMGACVREPGHQGNHANKDRESWK